MSPSLPHPQRHSPHRVHETTPKAQAALDGMTEEEKGYYQVMTLRLLRKLADYVEEQRDRSIEKNPHNNL